MNKNQLPTQMMIPACIKSIIQATLPGSTVLLFGSHARGDATAASDYDLLIITRQHIDLRSKMKLKTAIRKQLLAHKIFSDILIQSRDEVETKRRLPGHIVRNAIQEGMPL